MDVVVGVTHGSPPAARSFLRVVDLSRGDHSAGHVAPFLIREDPVLAAVAHG